MFRFYRMLHLYVLITVIILLLSLLILIEHHPTKDVFLQSENVARTEVEYNMWMIFVKVSDKSALYYNFRRLVNNILQISSIPITYHIISDESSKQYVDAIFAQLEKRWNVTILFYIYDSQEFAESIEDIVGTMTPHFSSKPGSYYSDALFYLSLGLYRIAPTDQQFAVMIDCDMQFKQDVKTVFDEFAHFKDGQLFGLAPELSPVYLHNLHAYKMKHPSTFGEYLHETAIRLKNGTETFVSKVHSKGFPGFNSGVVLLNLEAIRNSTIFHHLLSNKTVNALVKKYKFRGHLGDQDFYTLLGFEYPEMFRMLSCAFNRQLCTWWRKRGGYKDIFDKYYQCNEEILILHGNCKTRLPPVDQ